MVRNPDCLARVQGKHGYLILELYQRLWPDTLSTQWSLWAKALVNNAHVLGSRRKEGNRKDVSCKCQPELTYAK